MKRRILSLCLALLLAAPISAYAADNDDPLYGRATQGSLPMEAAAEGGVVMNSLRTAPGTKLYQNFTPRELADGETLEYGIDVSVWQDEIDWEAVAKSGVTFAIIRAGYRGYGVSGNLAKDGRFAEHIQGALDAGLKVGAYIFSQAITVEEAQEEARFLLEQVKGYDLELPLALDFEYASIGSSLGGRLYDAKLTKAQANKICNAFCQEVETHGYDSMVYANLSMLENQLNREQLGRLWLAHYTEKTSYTGDYEYWQCSSQGNIPGIDVAVDLNFWFCPGEEPVTTLPFTDVPVGSWFYDYVKQAYDGKIINGVSTTSFAPGDPLLRGQMIAMLYRMSGSPTVSGQATFQDLTEDYYKAPIAWGQSTGLVMGYSQEEFGPEDEITREDLVVLLHRMAGEPAASASLTKFSDKDSISDYAVKAVEWAVSTGLLQGYEDGTLQPQGHADRAEACALLTRYQALEQENTQTELQEELRPSFAPGHIWEVTCGFSR